MSTENIWVGGRGRRELLFYLLSRREKLTSRLKIHSFKQARQNLVRKSSFLVPLPFSHVTMWHYREKQILDLDQYVKALNLYSVGHAHAYTDHSY